MNATDEKAVYITPEGLQKLKEELAWREGVRRREIAEQIEAAIKEGDLSENAGYDEAKYQAGMNEGRIKELREKIKNAVLIKASNGPAEVVELGRTVTVKDLEFDQEEVYTIVGSAEADPGNGRISNESPIGQALMGKRVGSTVRVNTPGGELQFKVLHIE
ncbi:MAG: transcription elongation factor GreA [Caldilineae bacterium]|nr:MAG: transcription elongation factor GreA [Caldilineae bacterium]